jgi:hypothetical protein
MWRLLNDARTVRFRARIYAANSLDGCQCTSNWSELIRGDEWSVEAPWPNFLRIEKLRPTDHKPHELSLAVPGDLVLCDGVQLLEVDLVRSLFVTASAPASLERLETRMGLHSWFAPEVIFASDPFLQIERCDDPGPDLPNAPVVYRLASQPDRRLRLKADNGLPESVSQYSLSGGQLDTEVARTEFYSWQLNAELAPFVYGA